MATKKDNTAAQDAAKKALAAVQAKKNAEKTRSTAASTRASTSAPKAKVQHNITHVGQESTNTEELLAITRKNALPYRIGAIILWVLALAFEVFAILFFTHKFEPKFAAENPGWIISWVVCLVLDLVCVIIGSQLWKKGNHLDPASAKNKVRFWIHNNLGVFISVLAFLPFIIFVLLDKKADKKMKTIAAVAAVVALIIGGLTSVDWNPISQEELLEAAGTTEVFWTDSGTVYHLYEDCSHLNHSVELKEGTTTTAIENGKTRACKTCEARALREADEVAQAAADAGKTNEDTADTDADKTEETIPVVDGAGN